MAATGVVHHHDHQSSYLADDEQHVVAEHPLSSQVCEKWISIVACCAVGVGNAH